MPEPKKQSQNTPAEPSNRFLDTITQIVGEVMKVLGGKSPTSTPPSRRLAVQSLITRGKAETEAGAL